MAYLPDDELLDTEGDFTLDGTMGQTLGRLEEAACTEKDFRVVVEEWSRPDQNWERLELDHENLCWDVPLEYQAVPEPKIIPRWMGNPAYR